MSGGSKQQTTTSSNAPWEAAQGDLKRNLALSNKIGPDHFTPFPNSTIVPNATQTNQGLNAMQSTANQNIGGSGISGQFQNAINSGGMFGGQQNASNVMGSFAQGAGQVSGAVPDMFARGAGQASTAVPDMFARGSGQVNTQPFGNIARQATAPSFSQNNLSDFASGDRIGEDNPYFEDALRIASERTGDAVNLGASSAGRYGSGAHTQTLAREIGDMQTTSRARQVESDLNRMFGANQVIDAQRLAGMGMGLNANQAAANTQYQNNAQRMNAANQSSGLQFQNNAQRMNAANQSAGLQFQNNAQRLGAANQYANTQFQNNDQRINAANTQFGMGQQAFGNLGAAYQGQMAPAQTLMGVGANYEDMMSRQINDQIRRFEGQQQAPMRAIEWRNAIASGAGSMGGTSSSTAQVPGQNPFATALGIGNTAAGLFGSFS